MELSQVLRERKSVRHYKNTQISEEQLKYILYAAQAAPISRKDYSSIHITVVQEQNLMQDMITLFGGNADPFYGVPTLIIVSSKPYTKKEIPYLNVAGIIENMLLACTDLGLGSIYLTSFIEKVFQDDKIKKTLGVAEEFTPIAAVGVGYCATDELPEHQEEIEKRLNINRL